MGGRPPRHIFWVAALALAPRPAACGAAGDCASPCGNVSTVALDSWVQDDGSAEGRAAAAAAFDAAMRDLGMVCVTGAPLAGAAALDAAAAAFFDRPLAEKQRVGEDWRRYGPEGYTASGVEAVARSIAAGSGAAPDPVESFVFRRRPTDGSELCAQSPEFCAAAAPYWAAMEATLAALHRLSSHAITGASEDIFSPSFREEEEGAGAAKRNGNALRLAHYPTLHPEGAEAGSRYGEHTDYQTFTILRLARGTPGLEVKTRDGTWLQVGVGSSEVGGCG